MTLPKTILVPTDFGDDANAALSHALDFAKALDAEVVLEHGYELPVIGYPNDAAMIATTDLASRIAEGAQLGLDKTLEAHRDSGVRMRGIVKEGPTWRTILDAASEVSADLIVMGTHGRRGLSRALLGSVAEKVVRTATCPVMTVHARPQP